MAQTENALIVGGTAGLGLALARRLSKMYHTTVTGRRELQEGELQVYRWDITDSMDVLAYQANELLKKTGRVDLFVYNAGFFQEGRLDALSDRDIVKMVNVGLISPAFLLSRILREQGSIDGFIAVTSTSQFTPRRDEPVYTAVKGGLGMLANSVALDERVNRTLLVAPAGMDTDFWKGTGRDMNVMNDPARVAEKVEELYHDAGKYRFAKIHRCPLRVEVVEDRR